MTRQGFIQQPRPGAEAAGPVGDRSDDAEAEAKACQERRKIQNRKNQRAHRLRLKGKDAGAGQRLRPFEIKRWRLDEHEPHADLPKETSPASRGQPTMHVAPRPLHTCTGSSIAIKESAIIPKRSRLTTHHRPSSNSQPFAFPLSSDHLLHLIQHNVFRAFTTNKHALLNIPPAGDPNTSTSTTSSPYPTNIPVLDTGLLRAVALLHPNVPASLSPTDLQQDRDHSHWIDVIPFPVVRDNLIRHEGLFDIWDFFHDLVGEYMATAPETCPPHPYQQPDAITAPWRPRLLNSSDDGGVKGDAGGDDDDEVTAGRRGLIVWGEPHEVQSWEATPGFLAKWAWAVEGCGELVETSNRWRVRRGEEPMRGLGVR